MADVALLLAIRHQMADMALALKERTTPVVIEGEELQRRAWSLSYEREICEFDYGPDTDFSRQDTRPIKATYWPTLKPVLQLLKRLDQYIEAAQKAPQP